MAAKRDSWLLQPIGDDGRRRALLVAAAVIVAAPIGIAAFPRGDHAGSPRDAVTRPIVLGAHAPDPTDAATTTTTPTVATTPVAPTAPVTTAPAKGPMADLTVAQQKAILAAARRFLRAYLPYEVGRFSAPVRRGLRRSATSSLARTLIRRPARVPGQAPPPQGTIDGLELSDDPRAQKVIVAAMIERGTTISALTLEFQRHRGTWRVSSLG